MKKLKFMLGLIVLTISLLFCTSVYASSNKKEDTTKPVWVIVEQGVNIRRFPKIEKYDPIAAVEYLSQLTYVRHSRAKGWILVRYGGKLRYVSQSCISFEKPENARGPVEPDAQPGTIYAVEIEPLHKTQQEPEQNIQPEVIYEEAEYLNEEVEPAYVEQPEPVYEEPSPNSEPAAATGTYYYGTCFITHYCPCSACCGIYASGYTANGSLATPNWTVATGEDLPFGIKLLINGQVYEVQDRGVGSGCIDIFCSSHEEALARGAYYTDVYIMN